MNILHLESSPGWGGQEIRSLNEARGMRNRGHAIFFAIEKKGGLVSKAREAGFLVYELKYKKIFWLFTLFSLIWIIIKYKIDIVNTHSSSDGWLGGIASRLTGRKIIRTRHLSTAFRPGLNSYFLYNVLTDYVVTTCQCVVDTICQQSKKDKKFCCSIPTGVDIDKIVFDLEEPKKIRRRFNIDENDFLVGTACFMRSWKGIDDLLEAANILRDEKQLKWMIIGGGHADKYIKKAKDLMLDDRVVFTGHLDNPFASIASLNVFALLSTAHEGVSQASLQASYLQKPIIGTPTGGIKEVCIDYETGIQVDPFSPLQVKEAVLKLKNSPDLCSSMGIKAKELVLRKFTYKQMLDRMEGIYSMIIDN
jgi:glycosyltransferase involved in cell wall biosynthesis